MAEQNSTANPPAVNGGQDPAALKVMIAEIVALALTEQLKPVLDSVKAQGEQQKTLAEQLAKLSPAEKKDDETPKPLTLEDVAKAIDQREQAKAAAQAKSAKRAAAVEKLKAAGVAEELLVHVPESDDDAAIAAGVTKATERWNAIGGKAPNVGGAGKDGGSTQGGAPAPNSGGLTEGQAAYANWK